VNFLRQGFRKLSSGRQARLKLLANVNSRSRSLTFTFAIGRTLSLSQSINRYRSSSVRPSVCLSVVCDCHLSSATFVHPTQEIAIFAKFLHHLVPWPPIDIRVKFHGDCPRGTPPLVELNTRGVAEYINFGPIERYISETVQDRS